VEFSLIGIKPSSSSSSNNSTGKGKKALQLVLRGLCGRKGVTGGKRIRTRKVPKEKKKIILGAGVWQIVGKGKEEKKGKKKK